MTFLNAFQCQQNATSAEYHNEIKLQAIKYFFLKTHLLECWGVQCNAMWVEVQLKKQKQTQTLQFWSWLWNIEATPGNIESSSSRYQSVTRNTHGFLGLDSKELMRSFFPFVDVAKCPRVSGITCYERYFTDFVRMNYFLHTSIASQLLMKLRTNNVYCAVDLLNQAWHVTTYYFIYILKKRRILSNRNVHQSSPIAGNLRQRSNSVFYDTTLNNRYIKIMYKYHVDTRAI